MADFDNALERAARYAPFLSHLIERETALVGDIAAAARDPLCAARVVDPDMPLPRRLRIERRRLWVVDPIDGTRDYLRGRPGWSVSVALVEHGAVRIGILAAPARNELWIARVGEGATRNGRMLSAGSA